MSKFKHPNYPRMNRSIFHFSTVAPDRPRSPLCGTGSTLDPAPTERVVGPFSWKRDECGSYRVEEVEASFERIVLLSKVTYQVADDEPPACQCRVGSNVSLRFPGRQFPERRVLRYTEKISGLEAAASRDWRAERRAV